MDIVKKNNAAIFLLFNALLWGSSYVWSKMLLGYLPRFSILLLGSLGGLIATALIFRSSLKSIKKDAVVLSIIISLFSVISNTFFMFALQYTSSSNTAFIVQLSVVITPFLMALFEKKLPEGKVVGSAVIAMIGLFLLTCDFQNFTLNIGDLLALGNAIFFSIHLACLNRYSNRLNPAHFMITYHATNTIAFLAMAAMFEMRLVSYYNLATPQFAMLISASIFIAVVTVLIQSTAIRFVRPEKATIIYTLEPVTALVLAVVFLGEKFTGIIPVIGCALILVSVALSMYKPVFVQQPRLKIGISKRAILQYIIK